MKRRLVVGIAALVTACTPGNAVAPDDPVGVAAVGITDTTVKSPTATVKSPTTTVIPPTTTGEGNDGRLPPGVIDPPGWLGDRPLPTDPDGNPLTVETPAIMIDRRFATVDLLDPPADGTFESTVGPVPDEVLARSTWTESCPVDHSELAYATVTFRGFDERSHTGEMIVHESVAADIVEVFSALFAAAYPIEEMRVVSPADLEGPPTGDGNNTTAFVCRPVTGGTSWSQHAYGLAIDVNPFHNPYVRGETVLPEMASAYADRTNIRPGMIYEGDVVTTAFVDIGWEWGGHWHSLTDPQHFSRNGH